MLQITAEEINFILYQYLQESGFTHSSYTFGKESNIIENKYRHFHIPAGMLIVFLEKALTLIHIETHYSEGDEMIACNEPFSLLNPHHCSTVVNVKKPQPQSDSCKSVDVEMTENPIETLMNGSKLKGSSAVNQNSEIIDKEMEDDSICGKNYSMKSSIMLKSKGDLDLGSQTSNSLQTKHQTLLQNNGSSLKVLESISEKTLKLSWNPKNYSLVFCGDQQAAYLWNIKENIEDSKCIEQLPHLSKNQRMNSMMREKFTISCVDWNPEGDKFITGATDGLCRLWNTKDDPCANDTSDITSNQEATLEDFDAIYDCKWNKDGTAIVSVSEKHNVNLYYSDGNKNQTFYGHNEPVNKVDWKNSNSFATGDQGGIIKIWSLQNSSAIKTYKAHENSIKCLKWDHTGALLASGSEDCTIKIWNYMHDQPLCVLNENQEAINCLKWAPTGLGTKHEDAEVRLASCSTDGTIKIWNVSESKCVDTLQGHNSMVMCIDFDPTYKYLVSGDSCGRVIIWSVKDGTIIKTFENKSKKCIFEAQWSYDGILLATCYNDVSIIDIRYI